jgi:membrane protein
MAETTTEQVKRMGSNGRATEQPRDQAVPARSGLERRSDAVRERYAGSTVDRVWGRLTALEFIDRGIQFAGVLMLCFFPFLIVVNALAGRSAMPGFIRRLGLSQEAAGHVADLFASSASTAGAVGGVGSLFFVVSGIAAAGAVQSLYQHVYELPPRAIRDLPERILWLALTVGAGLAAGTAAPPLHRSGGPVLLFAVGLAAVVGFWWLSAWLLLAARVPWRDLLPTALATGTCWIGMQLAFKFTFSSMVVSNFEKYGQIGVVFSLMTWLVAIGVVIILGAVIGVAWRERSDRR